MIKWLVYCLLLSYLAIVQTPLFAQFNHELFDELKMMCEKDQAARKKVINSEARI